MVDWTEAYVHALVTDAGTLRDGQKLAQTGTWSSTGQNAQAAWGLVQGSGKDPYKVCIDLSGNATKCTCPSRKFPCKHAAGLMLLLAQNKVMADGSAPDWVTTWLEGRQRKAEAAPAPAKTRAPDPAAQAKREAAREARVASGVEELRLFLEDLARQGLEDPRIRSYEFWDRIAGRMVDAQMSPVAGRLRALGGLPFQRQKDWTSHLADEIGRLYTLTEAYARLDTLPGDLRHDVRAALGFTLKQDEVIALGPVTADRWYVAGQLSQSFERIVERRTWLYGLTGQRFALLQDFAYGNSPFAMNYPLGHVFQAELVYYPSATPQRAVFKQSGAFRFEASLAPFTFSGVDAVLDAYAQSLAQNPFLERIPAGLTRAFLSGGRLIDRWGHALPVANMPAAQWLLAVMGGEPVPVFGEWDGQSFSVISLVPSESGQRSVYETLVGTSRFADARYAG